MDEKQMLHLETILARLGAGIYLIATKVGISDEEMHQGLSHADEVVMKVHGIKPPNVDDSWR